MSGMSLSIKSHPAWVHGDGDAPAMSEQAKAVQTAGQGCTTAQMVQARKRGEVWVAIQDVVYDATAYCDYHPGGDDILRGYAGTDATSAIETYHPWVNIGAVLQACVLGPLVKSDGKTGKAAASSTAKTNLVMDAGARVKRITGEPSGAVLELEPVAVDKWPLPLLAGQHVHVSIPSWTTITRAYTPLVWHAGGCTLAVQAETERGLATRLCQLSPGDEVRLSGPLGDMGVDYLSGKSSISGSAWTPDSVILLSAGSGVTPVLAIAMFLREEAQLSDDPAPKITWLQSYRKPSRALCAANVQDIADTCPAATVQVNYTRSEEETLPPGAIAGRITKEQLEKTLPAPTQRTAVFICGPDQFCKQMLQYCKEMFYVASRIAVLQ